MNRTRRRSVVAQANEAVSITDVCRAVGMELPEDVFVRGRKLHCPFEAVYHRDLGLEPALRIYPDTNHAYCFACAATFTPVWLAAQVWGIPARAAARELLERCGIRPPSPDQVWAAAVGTADPPDTTLLSEALRTFCARTSPGWADQQFDPVVAAVLSRCLALLDRVRTDADAVTWLSGCKNVMSRVLTDRSVYTQQPHL